MATPTSTSRLENLPTELFSHILSYIYNPEACETEGSETKPLGYHFETSLLRTNKGIHRIAKDYLHDELSWVRFDINWASFLIDPHSAGVRYINIRRDPLDYYAFRVPQDAPHGRLHAKIEFPAASTDAQVVMADSVNGDTFPLMSLLVLEKDLTGFLRVLRMNDIAYCLRVFPNTVTDHDVCATPGLHGIKSVITVATGQSMKRYAHLVPEFKVMVGLLHRTKIVGHEDSVLAATIIDYIQHRHAYVEQKQLGLTTARMSDKLSRTLMWQAIGYMMRLKDQGEKYLRHGQYSSAHLCYAQTNIFEQGWLKMAPPPEDEFFWTPRNSLYDCFGVSMACNTTIAYLAGGLTVKTALPRTMGVLRWYHILLVSAGDRTLSTPRLLELTICMIVYYMLTVDLLDDQYLQALRWAVRTCENAFGVEGRNCLAKDLRPLHAAIKRFAKSEHISTARISQLKTLKALARGVACVPPLKWAIYETHFPSTLQEEMGSLAQIKRMQNDVIQNPSDICFEYAQFSEPIGEGRWSAEEGSRYVV